MSVEVYIKSFTKGPFMGLEVASLRARISFYTTFVCKRVDSPLDFCEMMYGKRVGGGMFFALDFSGSNDSPDLSLREKTARAERLKLK